MGGRGSQFEMLLEGLEGERVRVKGGEKLALRRRGGEIVMKHPFLKGFIIITIIKLCPMYDASVSINEFNLFEGTHRVGFYKTITRYS